MMKPWVRIILTFTGAVIIGMILAAPRYSHAAAPSAQLGALVKFQTDPCVYIVRDNNGLEWIPTEAEFKKRGFSFSQVVVLSDGELNNYHRIQVEAPVAGDVVVVQTKIAPNGTMVLVMDDGEIVTDEGGDTHWSLASISKLMTAVVLNDLNLDWSEAVTQSRSDEVGGARLRVDVGTKYRRIDLLHASLMGSANNSTHALARTSGITMSQFVARMNAKARELGMKNTHFVETTGLSPENVSTAKDIARLVEAASSVPRIALIGKKLSYTLKSVAAKPREHTIKTTNKLLSSGEQVSLGKTGFIDESGYNFTVMGRSPAGKERTVVVLNASSSAASFKLAREYINLK